MKAKPYLLLLVHYLSLTLGIVALLLALGMHAANATNQSPSFVRVIHASPDVGTADVFVDGSKLLSSFAFGSVTNYASVPAGPHKVQIALVGKGINAAAITQTLTVSPGVAYTVAAVGTNATGLSLEVFIDNNLNAPGTAKIRVYQLSPNFGPVSLLDGSDTMVSGISYQQASGYIAMSAGAHSFSVHSSNVNTTLPLSETLKANTVTSLFTVGLFNGAPKIALVPAQVNALPGLPGTGSDPRPLAISSQSSPLVAPWLLAALAFAMISTSVLTRRRSVAR
jgi:Domain of unknown function (DUF4397)